MLCVHSQGTFYRTSQAPTQADTTPLLLVSLKLAPFSLLTHPNYKIDRPILVV